MSPFLFVGLDANDGFILGEVEKFGELLEAVVLQRSMFGMIALHPAGEVGRPETPFFHFEAMGFEHIAQHGKQLFRLRLADFGTGESLALDGVAAAGAADVDVIRLLEFLDEVEELAGFRRLAR